MKRCDSVVMVTAFALLLGVTRWLVPERPMTYTGPRAILDSVFALGLLALILLLAGGLGRKVLRLLKVEGLAQVEQFVFSLPMGLGILAYGVLALGLVGLLRPWALFLWLLAAGTWTWREWSDTVSAIPGWVASHSKQFMRLGWGEKALLLAGSVAFLLALLQALSPPHDYDGLMYHLEAPRRFLQAGRIFLLPDIWQANGPFTTEMLYTLGLAWGSDVFAKLLHLFYAAGLLLATLAFGRRYLGRVEAWFAAALLLATPILPVWADGALADMAWALYEFLALYALILWRSGARRSFLLLASFMMGGALGSKYLAIGGAVVLGLWILWQGRGMGWRQALGSGLTFGAISLTVTLPWYAKNLLWSGNPVYPFFFGGLEWDRERLDFLITYLHTFGAGRRMVDYLLLPWNLYAQSARFSALGASVELPGLLLPLALLYPLGARRKVMDNVACLTGLRILIWAIGSQQARFLLPAFPALALLAASALVSLVRRFQPRWKGAWPSAYVLTGLAVAVMLMYQVAFFRMVTPTGSIVGTESKNAFLKRSLGNFSTLQFVQRNLTSEERALMMWDGTGYYCGPRCLPDADQSNWARLIDSTSTPAVIATELRSRGITHLLFNERDAAFFLHRDPTGRHQQALDFFQQEFLPTCGQEIYSDSYMVLVKIDCGAP